MERHLKALLLQAPKLESVETTGVWLGGGLRPKIEVSLTISALRLNHCCSADDEYNAKIKELNRFVSFECNLVS